MKSIDWSAWNFSLKLQKKLALIISFLVPVWWLYVFWKKKYFVFSFSHRLTWSRGQRGMWLHGYVHLTLSHQLVMFCGPRPCQRGYIMLLICHVATHDLMVRGSCDSIGGFLSPKVTNLLFLVVIGFVEEEIVFNLSHDLTRSPNQRLIWHYGWVSLTISHHAAKVGGHRLCRRGYILALVCHVTSCDHIDIGSSYIMGDFPSL